MAENLPEAHSSLPETDPRVDKPIFRGLRALVAAVPFVGGSISVLIESDLSARQSVRLNHLFERVAELQRELSTTLEQKDLPFSEALLEKAAVRAKGATESFRARILANCLFLDAETDHDEVLRYHIVELASSLTTLELAILLGMDQALAEVASNDLKQHLLKINLGGPTTKDLRDYSRQKLATLGLVTEPGPSARVTRIGQKLTSVLF